MLARDACGWLHLRVKELINVPETEFYVKEKCFLSAVELGYVNWRKLCRYIRVLFFLEYPAVRVNKGYISQWAMLTFVYAMIRRMQTKSKLRRAIVSLYMTCTHFFFLFFRYTSKCILYTFRSGLRQARVHFGQLRAVYMLGVSSKRTDNKAFREILSRDTPNRLLAFLPNQANWFLYIGSTKNLLPRTLLRNIIDQRDISLPEKSIYLHIASAWCKRRNNRPHSKQMLRITVPGLYIPLWMHMFVRREACVMRFI